MTPPADLNSGSIWQATIGALRADFGTLFAVAAPFTLLVSMVLAVFGPAPPTASAGLNWRQGLLLVVLPSLIATIAQIAIARIVARPGEAPRLALVSALAVLPATLAASGIILLASVAAIFPFVLPGLYLSARFFPLLAVAAIEGDGPAAMLRRCWTLTEGHGLALLWFVVLALLFWLGAVALTNGAGVAVLAAATLLGLAPIGHFLSALAGAVVGTFGTMAYAAAATVVYLRLVPAVR